MSQWTYDNILQLAPDAVVLEKAKRLARKRHWHILFFNDRYIWGSCKSSGIQAYEVAVALEKQEFGCSCASSKKPCKHCLAILLLFVEQKQDFRYTNETPDELPKLFIPPDSTPKVSGSGDDAKARKRAGRISKMAEGAVELERWLLDLFRFGLSNMESQGAAFWEDFAAQMVDAQMGGIARRIRLLSEVQQRQDWPNLAAQTLADLYLLAKALQKLPQLPQPLQQEVLTTAGMNQSKEELLTQQGIQDSWLVVGQQETDEENLRVRRTWLLGEKSQEQALLLDFAWGNQGFPMDWVVGAVLKGSVVFYEGNYQQRALVKKFELSTDPYNGLIGYADFETLAKSYAEALGSNPWLMSFPCVLSEVTPQLIDDQKVLVDIHRKQLPLSMEQSKFWKLMAVSGAYPLPLFGEWTGQAFYPLTLFASGRLISL